MTQGKPPGPWTLAAFSDVPYILDSIWRWAEFRAYRLGRVSLEAPHTFNVLAITPWPFFLAYAVISSFLIFGPTFTTLCVSFGLRVAEGIRVVTGIIVTVIAAVMLGLLLAQILSRLARRAAAQLVTEGPLPPETEPRERTLTDLAKAVGHEIKHPARLLGRIWNELRQVPAQARAAKAAILSLDGATQARLVIAFILLLLGAGIAIAPFAAAGVTLILSRYDADVCTQPHDAWRGIAQVLIFLTLLLLGWLLWKKLRDPKWALPQLAAVTVLWFIATLALWLWVAAPNAREATGGPYLQTYGILLVCLLVVTFAARWLAKRLTSGVGDESRKTLKRALTKTQLFDLNRPNPELGRMRIVAALVNGVVYHPLHLLLLPSLVAIMLPTHWLVPVALLFALLAMMLLAHGSVARRWEELIVLVERWFLSGTPLLVSILVIALAIMRLFDVQYVSTILDAAPVGVISALILAAYTTLWFVEYWINRWIAERLLELLDAKEEGRAGYVDYPCPESPPGDVVISPLGRVIALQSIGEFCVQGWSTRKVPTKGERTIEHAFTIYRLTDLFDRLAPGTTAANDVTRRVKAYFAFINLALLGIAIGLIFWQRGWDRPLSAYQVVNASDDAEPGVAYSGDLRALLADRARQRRPALIVAASGGGTRAALYTATALEGLAKINRTQDIVLLSGVSGGGVAAAYFASAHEQLGLAYERSAPAWEYFKHIVTEPFIEDVLDGVGELRVAADVPLGQLLAESLERRVFRGPVKTFGELRGPALMLNATISGHPWPDSEILKDHVGILRPNDPCPTQSEPFASLAGSRLIFTNLKDVAGFPRAPMIMPDVGLSYKVIRDPRVPLATAAALNANFPPVFSNARVRIAHKVSGDCTGYSYFVTDGGATENLGLVSALYELRSVLNVWAGEARAAGSAAPPQIDIVAIEASAITYDYTEDRGVGAATGGSKERINGALTTELTGSINQLLAALGAPPLRLHYIPLPLAFRSRGGFGTHWMYADTIRVSNPLVPKLGNRLEQWWNQRLGRTSYVYLDHEDIKTLWTALFDPKSDFCVPDTSRAAQVQQVARWVCGHAPEWDIDAKLPDLQIGAWRQLVADLSGPTSE